MKSFIRKARAYSLNVFLMLAVITPLTVSSKTVKVEVITAIEKPDCQSGTKSTQKILVDTITLDVQSSHTTGTTNILGCEFSSINDHFVVEGLIQDTNGFRFNVVGRTATVASLGLGGEIDYQLKVAFDTNRKVLTINGKHDGYPTYYVKLDDELIYQFDQTNLTSLLGDLEITMPEKTSKY